MNDLKFIKVIRFDKYEHYVKGKYFFIINWIDFCHEKQNLFKMKYED